MALCKLNGQITMISGSVGGMVFCNNKNGNVAASPRRRVKKRSRAQGQIRNAFSTCKAHWRKNVTADLSRRWGQYAKTLPTTNRIGETVTLTAWQMFVRMNIVRIFYNLPVLLTPPA